MVFFYLVTTGWIFYISLCENSINQKSKFDFTVDEGKEWLNASRKKNYRRRKVDEKSCLTFLLCDPG